MNEVKKINLMKLAVRVILLTWYILEVVYNPVSLELAINNPKQSVFIIVLIGYFITELVIITIPMIKHTLAFDKIHRRNFIREEHVNEIHNRLENRNLQKQAIFILTILAIEFALNIVFNNIRWFKKEYSILYPLTLCVIISLSKSFGCRLQKLNVVKCCTTCVVYNYEWIFITIPLLSLNTQWSIAILGIASIVTGYTLSEVLYGVDIYLESTNKALRCENCSSCIRCKRNRIYSYIIAKNIVNNAKSKLESIKSDVVKYDTFYKDSITVLDNESNLSDEDIIAYFKEYISHNKIKLLNIVKAIENNDNLNIKWYRYINSLIEDISNTYIRVSVAESLPELAFIAPSSFYFVLDFIRPDDNGEEVLIASNSFSIDDIKAELNYI